MGDLPEVEREVHCLSRVSREGLGWMVGEAIVSVFGGYGVD